MAKKLKEVGFNYSHGEERTETIKVDGYKPFDITFVVPDSSDKLSYGMDINDLGKGKAVFNFIVSQVKSWTLPKEFSEKELQAVNDVMVLAKIVAAIDGAGEEVKN